MDVDGRKGLQSMQQQQKAGGRERERKAGGGGRASRWQGIAVFGEPRQEQLR